MSNSTLDPARAPTRQVAVRIDESDMTTAYANAIRTSPTTEEVVLDFGMNLPRSGGNGTPAQVFTIDSRVVVNWANAKRLAMSLTQMVRAFEQQHGEIALSPTASPVANG